MTDFITFPASRASNFFLEKRGAGPFISHPQGGAGVLGITAHFPQNRRQNTLRRWFSFCENATALGKILAWPELKR